MLFYTIFPSSGIISMALYQSAHGVAFAINQINKRHDILPNVTLGYVILDDCGNHISAIPRMVQLLPVQERDKKDRTLTTGRNYDVTAIIGTTSELSSLVLSTMAAFYQVSEVFTFFYFSKKMWSLFQIWLWLQQGICTQGGTRQHEYNMIIWVWHLSDTYWSHPSWTSDTD